MIWALLALGLALLGVAYVTVLRPPRSQRAPGLRVELFVTPNSAESERVSALYRRATELKKSDIGAAIDCIKEAQQIARQLGPERWPIDFWLRLPTFLQLAGRTEEASVVFAQIGDEINSGRYASSLQAKAAYRRALRRSIELADKRSKTQRARSSHD